MARPLDLRKRRRREREQRNKRDTTILICHCHGISDRKIRRLVRRGARSAAEVAEATGAGTNCGGCRPAVKQVVHSEMARQLESTPASAIVQLQVALEA